MSLATLSAFKLHIGVSTSTDDTPMQTVLDGASAGIEHYCHRVFASTSYTEYYSGTGARDVTLRQCPVTAVASVYHDPFGAWGQGASAFGATALMVAGQDYALVIDEGSSTGGSGILRRVGTGGFGVPGAWPSSAAYGLAAGLRPGVWARGDGNIKVTYTAGYSSTPADVALACMMLSAFLWRTRKYGGVNVSSESLGEYSYSLMAGARAGLGSGAVDDVGSVAGLLQPYVLRAL